MQLGATAAESVSIKGNDVILRADGRAEVYDLSYVRMLVPYLIGERDVPPMRLAHFRPGIKPWLCLSVIEDDGSEPNLAGVAIYSGLGSHREMGLHLNRSEAWRLAEMLTRAMPVQHQRQHENDEPAKEQSRGEQDPAA